MGFFSFLGSLLGTRSSEPFDKDSDVKSWDNKNSDGTVRQYNDKIVNPKNPDYGSHRFYNTEQQRSGVAWGNERNKK